jgi:hypothetical protein
MALGIISIRPFMANTADNIGTADEKKEVAKSFGTSAAA